MQPFPLPGRSWFEAWNPDGSAFVGVDGAGGFKDLLLFDGATGTRTGSIPLDGAQATHPDWSADGARIAFTEVGMPHDDQTPAMGGISYVEQQGGAWSALRRLVPAQAGSNRYYPTIAPDNSTVVFDRSVCPAGRSSDSLCDADVDPSARLWSAVIPPAGAATAPAAPVELAAANAAGVNDGAAVDLTTSYPKWSPFAFRLSEERGLFWVSFSSSRSYGLRAPTQGGDHHGNPSGLLIWMAGVDPQAVAGGRDGSFPAFCLPFQSLTTSNHIAQWTSGVPVVP
jgi:dipeptidyl aminopeptidase/acylaminoacyl peptidase